MSERIYVADKATLDKVYENTQKLLNNLVPLDSPVYGMIIHEADLDPATRVEYIGANKDFTPMMMNMDTHIMDYGSWGNWEWLKANKPVMANWGGGIEYYLNENDYTKKASDGSASDVANVNYAGNAMAVIKKIYTHTYKIGYDRYVLFCERKLTDDFKPIGFDVLGKERDYMLIPLFYGSIDGNGKMRSIAGQWSWGTATGNTSDTNVTANVTTEVQNAAIKKTDPEALFFGGALMNTLADICVMLTRSTNTQASFGAGMSTSYVNDKEQKHGTKVNTVIGGGQFYGSKDEKSFNKVFHSCVLGSQMLWQRDPYTLLVNGIIKVSPDYTYDLTGAKYIDTGVKLASNNYYAITQVIPGFGAVPTAEVICTSLTGYCDHTWVTATDVRVSFRLGGCGDGAHGGLFSRTFNSTAACAWWNDGASLLQAQPVAA